MNLNLIKKTAIVCGSTQGLGFAVAVELALLGCNVVLFARNQIALEETVKKLDTSLGQQHSYLVADFLNTLQVKQVVDNFVLHTEVDILINNTGGPAGGPILAATSNQFLETFQAHVINNHHLVQAVVPAMKKNNFGRIVNIISTSVKAPLPNLGVSNTIRAAVANWAKTLANELAPFGITVNNVLPGFTKTQRAEYIVTTKAKKLNKTDNDILQDFISEIPVGRIGLPEEIGGTVAFLCSPVASYITGINLPVDGGRLSCL